jgi:hypothetical protein
VFVLRDATECTSNITPDITSNITPDIAPDIGGES